jgi:hypothetical protein
MLQIRNITPWEAAVVFLAQFRFKFKVLRIEARDPILERGHVASRNSTGGTPMILSLGLRFTHVAEPKHLIKVPPLDWSKNRCSKQTHAEFMSLLALSHCSTYPDGFAHGTE